MSTSSTPARERDNWDVYFMSLAFMAASRSTCTRRSVGAILVQDRRIVGTGYNGSPAGTDSCLDIGCMMREGSCVRTIHAEVNLMLGSDRDERRGSTVYVTDRPCWTCANVLANSGIQEVVYARPYPKGEEDVRNLFADANVRLRQVELPQERIDALLGDAAIVVV